MRHAFMESCWSTMLLLLLSVTKTVDCYGVIGNHSNDIEPVSCPTNCTCFVGKNGASSLKIECMTRTGHQTSLSEEIDAFLSGRVDDLVDLVITDSPLMSVPKSVCQLVHLQSLDISNNKLTSLPVDCFNKMIELQCFKASSNQLVEIQQGVFDGLVRLQKISLRSNAISTIGLHSFTSRAGLASLMYIDLSYNQLTELEPWPLMRGQMLPKSYIDLGFNMISNFTNQLNWSFRCGDKFANMSFELSENNIQHITDMCIGWNITRESVDFMDFFCLFGPKSYTPFHLNLHASSFVCDCLDYDFYKMIHFFPHMVPFDPIFCNEPPDLHEQRAIKVPLEQFVCAIASPPCPDGCHCVKRPFNETYVVTCRNNNTLPLLLPDTSQPPPTKAKYQLEFGKSSVSIPVVEHRDYFNNTISLNVSSSGVKNVTNEAWRAFVKFKFKFVDLANNLLTSLPVMLETENLTFRAPHQLLALEGNPFLCACEDRWMRDWLLSLGQALYQPESVLCDNPDSSDVVRGKNILKVTDAEFCYDPNWEMIKTILKTVIPAVFGSVLFVGSVFSLLYRLRVRAYVNLNIHPFDVDECEGEDMTYDIFLSCAHEDHEVGRWIVDRLERQRSVTNASYKVCYHERDFYPGTLITENIQLAIERSRRVVCLVSRHFLHSEYCVMEFCGAWNHHMRLNKRRLIVIKWPEVDVSEMDVSQRHQQLMSAVHAQTTCGNIDNVKLFLSTHTYIEYGSDNWWDQLLYALPINSLPPVDSRTDQDLTMVGDVESTTNDDNPQIDVDEDLLIH